MNPFILKLWHRCVQVDQSHRDHITADAGKTIKIYNHGSLLFIVNKLDMAIKSSVTVILFLSIDTY